MQTISRLRMFIVAATMTAISCSEPVVEPDAHITGHSAVDSTEAQVIQIVEYNASVLTWTKVKEGTYAGLITSVRFPDLSKITVYIKSYGQRYLVDKFFDESKINSWPPFFDGYFWLSSLNDILVINFLGGSTDSIPPFPLDLVIVSQN